MTTAFYRTGTVAVTQNSKVVTGTGTNWTTGPTKPLAGDVFIFNNKMYEIDSVVSDTEIRLYRNFEDSTASSKSYAIMRNASLNISARIAAQVAQVVNQKQIMIDEFHDFLTNNTDSTVPLTDTLGNTINVTPIPMLDKDYVEKIGGIDAAVNQAIQDINDKFDSYEYILMREAEARAIQWQNENVNFDASGFVNAGKASSSTVYNQINSGMYTRSNAAIWKNKVAIGRNHSDSIGTSKTNFAVTNLAGAICNLVGAHTLELADSLNEFVFELPEAEDGTRIYDSTGNARGSGKASLDLKVDVDPKYGDVPTGTEDAILREARSRAFEGQVINGDFRSVSSGWEAAPDRGTADIDATGVVITDTTNASPTSSAMWLGNIGNTTIIDETYIVEVVVESLTDANAMRVRLGGYGDPNMHHEVLVVGRNTFTYTAGLTRGSDDCFHLYLGRNATAKVTSFSVRRATEEVVTHPVDLVALEYYEEELTGRQEVFECIQSLSTTFGKTSVPTVLSTRKLSYFQQYDGQFPEVTADPDYINDRYRCVVWDDLTEPQKREVAAYMGEKLFKGVNGHIVNGRLRARTFRGLGNGDWYGVDSTSSSVLRFTDLAKVRPQASNDTVSAFTVSNSGNYGGFGSLYTDGSEVGVYKAYSNTSGLYQGRCFMYVVATVPRANKGAYHPDLNPWGCANFGKDITAPHYQYMWYSTLFNVNTIQDCWKYRSVLKDAGSIDVGYSGHPDGIFYDGIEAGGLNGIIDWRLSAIANDSPEEAAKVEAKVENGTYRGLEKLVRTVPVVSRNTTNASTSEYHAVGVVGEDDHLKGLKVTKLIAIDGGVITGSSSSFLEAEIYTGSGLYYLRLNGGISRSITGYYILETETNLSVSGEFSTQMVIADPVNFLKVFPNGILGTWCPVIPEVGGSQGGFPITRKVIGTSSADLQRIYTSDLGNRWSYSGTVQADLIKNTRPAFDEVVRVEILQYKAFAKQTKPSTNKPVYNAKAGLMKVVALDRYTAFNGASFVYSLIGKVPTSSTERTYASLCLPEITITNSGRMIYITHESIPLVQPNNDSPAVKALPYQISNNGQGSIGYQANELTWGVPTFKEADTTVAAILENEIYYITSSAGSEGLLGHTVRVRADNASIDWSNYSVISGVVCSKNTKIPSGVLELWNGSFWGDDSTVKITTEGSDTFVDLNGNTNLSVVHELAIPYTWTSNHARAGEQIEGVDL